MLLLLNIFTTLEYKKAMTCKTIYSLLFKNNNVQLVLPSIDDIKCMIMENEELLNLLLLNQLIIVPKTVNTDSKIYKTALHNRILDTT